MVIKVILFFSLCLGSVWAAQEDAPVEELHLLFNNGSHADACSRVDDLLITHPWDIELNILYGRCAVERGDYDTAIAAYDMVEIMDESHADLHKHLGDLYVKIGQYALAKRAYEKAGRLSGTPVERRLLSPSEAHAFSWELQIHAGYDSNVEYRAELSDMIEWYGTADANFTEPESAYFHKEQLLLTHLYDGDPFSPFYYKNTLYAYNKNFETFSNADLLEVTLSSGPGYRSETVDVWIPLQYSYIAMDYDTYAESFIITPQLLKRLQNGLQISADAAYSRQKNRQWDGADQDAYEAGAGISRWFGDNYAQLSYHYLKAKNTHSGSPRIFIDRYFNEVGGSYTRRFNGAFEAGIGYIYRNTLYDDIANVADPARREDTLHVCSGYASYMFGKGIQAVLQYDRYDNTTNYTPADYTKELASLGLSLTY